MKKITAQEKHYIKRNKNLAKEIKNLNNIILELQKVKDDYNILCRKYQDIQKENQKLKTMKNLTDQEVKELMAARKTVDEFFGLVDSFV